MNKALRKEIVQYIRNQNERTPFILEGVTKDLRGTSYPQRQLYVELRDLMRSFHDLGTEPRWVIMPGIRGVGKTTLMGQLFLSSIPHQEAFTFFLSVDEVVRRFNVNLWDIMEVYEEIMGMPLERLTQNAFFFFDEVQYDEKWDTALKTFYDRSKRVFIFCTGSSATTLRSQLSADSARRAYFLEMHPLYFREYMHLSSNKDMIPDLSAAIREAIFHSSSGAEVVERLYDVNNQVQRYWGDIGEQTVNRFFTIGSLPIALTSINDAAVLNQIEQILHRIIYTDIGGVFKFDADTLNSFESLLYILADKPTASITALAKATGQSKNTVISMLQALVSSDLLQKLLPYGSHSSQVRKPAKYVFTSPAFRYQILIQKDSTRSIDIFKSILIEDVAVQTIRQGIRPFQGVSFTYDAAEKGADFIFKFGPRLLPMGISYDENSVDRVRFSMKRTKANYGILATDTEKPTYANGVAIIPLEYFLLL